MASFSPGRLTGRLPAALVCALGILTATTGPFGGPGRRPLGPCRLADPLRHAAGAQGEQCALIQSVTAEDRANVGLTVIVLKTADNKSRLMRIVAPMGVLLPSGLGLKIDNEDVGRAGFVRCLPNGCVAEVVMDGNLIKQMRTGQTATFIIFQTPEEGIGFPMSLKGFGEGFDSCRSGALPVVSLQPDAPRKSGRQALFLRRRIPARRFPHDLHPLAPRPRRPRPDRGPPPSRPRPRRRRRRRTVPRILASPRC